MATEEENPTKERDVYDTMLTQGEIQEGVSDVNTAVKKQEAEEKCESPLLLHVDTLSIVLPSPSPSPSVSSAVKAVNDAIQSGGKTALLRSLQSGDTRFANVNPQNTQWYFDVLSKAMKDKAEAEVSLYNLVGTVPHKIEPTLTLVCII